MPGGEAARLVVVPLTVARRNDLLFLQIDMAGQAIHLAMSELPGRKAGTHVVAGPANSLF